MADDKFQNGLFLPDPGTGYAGRTVCRWLAEWLVNVVGWTVVDKSGSQWDNYLDSGTDGASVVDEVYQFQAASASFDAADAGGYLKISGMTPSTYDGIYRIKKVLSSTKVVLDCQYGIHSSGIPCNQSGLTWKLWRLDVTYLPTVGDWIVLAGAGTTGSGYTFHLYIEVDSTSTVLYNFPKFIISPFASWNAGTHTWNDAKRTSVLTIANYGDTVGGQPATRIWAVGDTDRFVLMIRMERDLEGFTSDGEYAWHFLYAGEIDTFHQSADPKPCILWHGSNDGSTTPAGDSIALIGYGQNSTFNGRGHWLAYDDTTTVAGYMAFQHLPTSTNVNWVSENRRRFSAISGSHYLIDPICECRTVGYMEYRGRLRRLWITGRELSRLKPIGASNEYLHIIGGITFPWNGSRTFYER
jgi:hypothetical protein